MTKPSETEENSGKASSKQRSISQTLSLFSIASTLALGLMVLGFLSLRIGQAVSDSQQAHAQSQIRFLANDISQYLRNREQILKDHAHFPIMVQGVMQPKINQGILQDFMANLTFLDKPYQQVLLDFQGKTIHSSQESPMFDYTQYKWVNSLIEGKLSYYRGISQSVDGAYYWRLALPIIYNQLPEGILLVEIPINELEQQLSNEHLGGITLEIFWRDQFIKRIGQVIENGKNIDLIEPLSQAILRFTIDTSISQKIRNRLLIENFLLLLLLSFIAATISIYLGKRWFIDPILQLQTFTRKLAENSNQALITRDHDVKELKELADDFNLMARRIRRREDALQASHDELKDVNEKLKSSQLQLVQSEKMASIGTLAAGVAHEINNPVSFIKSNLTTLQQYLSTLIPLFKDYEHYSQLPKDESTEQLTSIKQQIEAHDIHFILEDITPLLNDTAEGADRVKTIVAGLKTFVRMDETEDQLFSINECIESTLKVVWNELKYKCQVHQHLSEIPLIKGSPGQINQVITNLLINAVQAIPKQGEITIKTETKEGQIILRISDTGTGISPENLQKLFTPFFTTKEVGQGTGLGLSISYGIIEQHGGTMTATSELGKGTTFTIQLPFAEQ